MVETTINILSDETIQTYVGACMGCFAFGWCIATLFKWFNKLGEKI